MKKSKIQVKDSGDVSSSPVPSPPAPPPPPPPPSKGPPLPPPPPPPSQEDEQPVTEALSKILSNEEELMKKLNRKQKGKTHNQPVASLSSLLSPAALLQQKKTLKSVDSKKVMITRKSLMEASNTTDYLQLYNCYEYLKVQSQTADVTVLAFGGLEHLSDLFMYTLSVMGLDLYALKKIDITGCRYVSDFGIKFLCNTFKSATLKTFEADGCQGLTEKTLLSLKQTWGRSLEKISMVRTNVSMIPEEIGAQLSLEGCPVISPLKENATLVQPNCFKMVVVTGDKTLPWNPLGVLLNEEDLTPCQGLQIRKGVTIKRNTFNVFQLPDSSPLLDLVLSEGTIIVVPFIVTEGTIDEYYNQDLVQKLLRLFVKCPECQFILLGLTDQSNMIETSNHQQMYVIKEFEKKVKYTFTHELENVLSRGRRQRFGNMMQSMLTSGLQLVPSLPNVTVKDHFVLATPTIGKDNTTFLNRTILAAKTQLMDRFPAYFMPYDKELDVVLSKIEKAGSQFCRLQDTNSDIRKIVADALNLEGNRYIQPLGKIYKLMARMGKLLYLPCEDDMLVLTDFTMFEAISKKLLDDAAPCEASWRHLGFNVPCWTRQDLMTLLPDKEKLPLLLGLLVKMGVVLKMSRDTWTTQIQDTSAYIVSNILPFQPTVDMEDIWPTDVPEDELQIDRMLHFYPSLPESFFSHLARECLELGGVRLLWKNGIIINKGPVTLLIEILSNYEETPVVFISARLQNGKKLFDDNNEVTTSGDTVNFQLHDNPFLQTLFVTMNVYRLLVGYLAHQQKLYCVDKVPCATCLTSSNRYEIVNKKDIWLIRDIEIRQKLNTSKTMTCQRDRQSVNLSAIIGPQACNQQMMMLVPTHHYLGCVPGFSAFNRCLFCQNCAMFGADCPGNLDNGQTTWNCSCNQDGPMCDKCGICQRCDLKFSELVSFGYMKYSRIGSINHLKPDAKHTHDIELTPNYSPVMEVTFVEEAAMLLELKMGAQMIKYDTEEGMISEHQGATERSSKLHDNYICKKGDLIEVKLSFSKEDMSDMVVKIYLCGVEIYSLTLPAQSCTAAFLVTKVDMTIIVNTPGARKIPKQGIDDTGEKKTCSLVPGIHSQLEASLLQSKSYLENVLFQAGGVNFSGSTYLLLPREITANKLQVPSYSDIKIDHLVAHLLCYTRTKVSDALTFSGTHAVPESWSVYRMIHFLDSPGVELETKELKQLQIKCKILLWAWSFVFKMMSRVTLPKTYNNLLGGATSSLSVKQLEAGLADLVDLSFWRLTTNIQIDEVIKAIDDTVSMMKQSEALQSVSKDHSAQLGHQKVSSMYNPYSILYLCDGHSSSVKVEQGLSKMLPSIYGTYSEFLLSVDMPSNQLTELPEEAFKALPNLMEFDCSRNYIEVLPNSISCCKKLYSLQVAENNLTDLPGGLVQCQELWRLNINSNRMERLPSIVTRLTSLRRLYANNMFMTSLPPMIGNLVNLDKLYINGNCFTSLPPSFTKLQNLTDLGLAGVPFNISRSKVLSFENFKSTLTNHGLDRWLENNMDKHDLFNMFDEDKTGVLDETGIGRLNAYLFNLFPRFGYKGQEAPDDTTPSGFPMEILQCQNLEYLNIFYQGIVSVPPEIGKLQELKIINMSHNPNLLTLPAEIGSLSCLTRLELDGCPLLKTPPKEIRAKGFSTTFAYLKRLSSGSLPCKRTKLMMVGLGGAGKTSLVESLLSKDGKADLTHGEAITDGIDITTWSVKHEDETVTYSVWDFAGQTVYYNTHQFFLSNRAVYLLVWNVRLGYEHAGLDFWLSSISVQAPKAPIFVVGSHVDQVSKFEIPIHDMKARYKNIAGFHFVSSYTGEGIKELQDKLFEVTLHQQYMGEQIPEVWLSFENNVISARTSKNVIQYTALEKMANISGIFEKREVDQAVQFLHELGSLQHFSTELLKKKVVINPQWIVDVMACIVSVKNSPIKEGRLEHADISVVWKDYPEDLHDWLLKLTEEYDLTFPLENQSASLVPCLLPEKPPDDLSWPEVDKEADIKENKMIYKFDYLPAGLFNRGQVRLHQMSDGALIWKKGSLLKKNGHIALLQQTRQSELIVLVQGPRPENMIFLVHEVFEGLISESFRGVTFDYLMPCPDCLKIYAKEPHMFAASTIRRALELKAPFLQCVRQFHTISCIDLLACMPPDNHSDFDVHLVQSVRNLRDLRKDLSADIFFSYCEKDAPSDRTSVIHPATVCDDMKALGYKCWFPEKGHQYKIEEMARALTDASVFVVFMSQDYVKNEECVNIFKYARLTLRKPLVLVAVGDNFDWKQSKLGILLSDEVFVNMIKSKREVYQAKLEELIQKVHSRSTKTLTHLNTTPSCFFSYTWVNSASAVALGTKKVPGAVGHGDPREIKKYLEEKGVKCWIDIERIGQNGLFDDIAEGLLSAKVVIVCVSEEYASSPTCQIEFRYAANTLKIPMIMAVVGTGSKWRASEVGVLSLNYPLVSFQEKSETAYSTLLDLVKERLNDNDAETTKEQKNKMNEKQKNLSFQELFELAQRKLLRQLCFYAEHHDIDVYPRLFAIDFRKSDEDKVKEASPEEQGEEDGVEKPPLTRGLSRKQLSKRISNLKPVVKQQHFCVHTLCEHDEGWHSVADPIPLPNEFGETMLDNFCPFISRITAVMKYNKSFDFMCRQHEFGEEYLQWLEENPQATMSDYQQIYHEFRQMVLDLDTRKKMGQLARCRLPNGKTIWLCQRHQKAMKVTVLTGEATQRKATLKTGNEVFTVAGLRAMDPNKYKFTSPEMAMRRHDPDAIQEELGIETSSNYELLPDKKLKPPEASVKSKNKSKAKTNEAISEKDETDTQKQAKEVNPVSSSEDRKELKQTDNQTDPEINNSVIETPRKTASPEELKSNEPAKEKADTKKIPIKTKQTAEVTHQSKTDKTAAETDIRSPKKLQKKTLSEKPAMQTLADLGPIQPVEAASGSKGDEGTQGMGSRSKTFFGGQMRQNVSKQTQQRPSSARKESSGNKSKACSIS